MKQIREILGYLLGGVVVWLWTWQSALVWLAFLAIMLVQVINEERRLHRDFGDEYAAYRRLPPPHPPLLRKSLWFRKKFTRVPYVALPTQQNY